MKRENSMIVDPSHSFLDMPLGEPFICSFSGGKDSVLALSLASEKGNAKGLIHWSNKLTSTSTFHEQSISIVKQQALNLDLPLTITSFSPKEHRLELLKIYEDFASQGIKSIVFGDIYLMDSVKLQSILCKKAGLIPRYPLWERNYADLMRNINKHEIILIISRINIEKLDSKWLGVAFNQEVYQEFMKLDIDPFGENGEFHTTVVDGKIFKNPLKYSINTTENTSINLSIHSLSDNTLKLI